MRQEKLMREIMGRVEKSAPPVNGLLVSSLSAAVPLWILKIKDRQPDRKGKPTDEDYAWMREMDAGDLCLRMEYLHHKGPKPGDTAKVFNETARLISILAFCPGGVTVFGQKWEADPPEHASGAEILQASGKTTVSGRQVLRNSEGTTT